MKTTLHCAIPPNTLHLKLFASSHLFSLIFLSSKLNKTNNFTQLSYTFIIMIIAGWFAGTPAVCLFSLLSTRWLARKTRQGLSGSDSLKQIFPFTFSPIVISLLFWCTIIILIIGHLLIRLLLTKIRPISTFFPTESNCHFFSLLVVLMHHGPHHRFAHQNHDDDDVMVSWIIMMYHDGHTVGVHPVCRDRLLIRPVCAHLSFFTIFTQLFHSATIFTHLCPNLSIFNQIRLTFSLSP